MHAGFVRKLRNTGLPSSQNVLLALYFQAGPGKPVDPGQALEEASRHLARGLCSPGGGGAVQLQVAVSQASSGVDKGPVSTAHAKQMQRADFKPKEERGGSEVLRRFDF